MVGDKGVVGAGNSLHQHMPPGRRHLLLYAEVARLMSCSETQCIAQSKWWFRSSAATHAGTVRTQNEDSHVDRPDLGLWAVADGAGGHEAGGLAARSITDTLRAIPTGLAAADLLAEVRLRLAETHNALAAEAA